MDAGPDSELNNRDECKIDETNAAQWSTACQGKGIEEIHEGTPFYECRSDLPCLVVIPMMTVIWKIVLYVKIKKCVLDI